jgi:hypothetical protein
MTRKVLVEPAVNEEGNKGYLVTCIVDEQLAHEEFFFSQDYAEVFANVHLLGDWHTGLFPISGLIH